ncbi:hypothetical protein [Methanobrevibacter sp.]|uniref:hypothetical protein n=1 Tax=Methanobrevibacter sp. TaxID=66852 RepID=UPI003862E0BA
MSSRSATVLVIFTVACVAFCLASVFAAMTGPISILPNETNNTGILDNLSALTDQDNDNYQSYGYDDSNDYSSNYDDQQQSEETQIETTTDDSHTGDTNQPEESGADTSDEGTSHSSSSSGSSNNIENTIG